MGDNYLTLFSGGRGVAATLVDFNNKNNNNKNNNNEEGEDTPLDLLLRIEKEVEMEKEDEYIDVSYCPKEYFELDGELVELVDLGNKIFS